MKLIQRIQKFKKYFQKTKPFLEKPRDKSNGVWRKLNEKIKQASKKIKIKKENK